MEIRVGTAPAAAESAERAVEGGVDDVGTGVPVVDSVDGNLVGAQDHMLRQRE